MTKMLRLPAVIEVTGLSQSTIWRREREGTFPRRRRVGPNAVAWREDEIRDWVESLPEVEPDTAA